MHSTYVCIIVYAIYTCIFVNLHIYIYIYQNVYIYIYMYMYMYICICICICIYVYVYVYMYMYICICKSVITVPGLTGDASWVHLGVAALRFTGARDVLSLGGGGRGPGRGPR